MQCTPSAKVNRGSAAAHGESIAIGEHIDEGGSTTRTNDSDGSAANDNSSAIPAA